MAFFININNELTDLVNLSRQTTSKFEGLKIDEPSGLGAIHAELGNYNAIKTTLAQEASFIKDAKSVHNILSDAGSAISEIANDLEYLREITVFAKNTTLSTELRDQWGAEVSVVLKRILNKSNEFDFQGNKLLDGSFEEQSFVVGRDADNEINVALASVTPQDLGIFDLDISSTFDATNATQSIDEALASIASISADVQHTRAQLTQHLTQEQISFVKLTEDEIVDLEFKIVSDGKHKGFRRNISANAITTYLYSQHSFIKFRPSSEIDTKFSFKI